MSLSQEPVFNRLQNEFVCGTIDITGQPWSGFSGVHPIEAGAVHTTNGAGPHNIQMFILSPDGTVLSCLPGYWHPDDLSHEMDLAKELNAVWTDKRLSRTEKDERFQTLHLEHVADHSSAMVRRSQMQSFDKQFEQKQRLESTDTIRARTGGKDGGPIFKTTDVIFHERIAKQGFLPYSKFDFVALSDYGRPKYDKKEEGGLPAVDLRPQTLEKKRIAEAAKKRRLENRRQSELRKQAPQTKPIKRIRPGTVRGG